MRSGSASSGTQPVHTELLCERATRGYTRFKKTISGGALQCSGGAGTHTRQAHEPHEYTRYVAGRSRGNFFSSHTNFSPLLGTACPVCVLCVPAPPGVFEPGTFAIAFRGRHFSLEFADLFSCGKPSETQESLGGAKRRPVGSNSRDKPAHPAPTCGAVDAGLKAIMLRRSAQCFGRASTALAASRAEAAAAAASDGLAALPPSPAPTLQLGLLNAQGVALHLLGDVQAAHESLGRALDVALTVARDGAGDDDYSGIAGCLIDLAANHLLAGDVGAADKALKRSQFMLTRAYRPSETVHACLLNVQGLLHEARDEPKAALDAHQRAHHTLLEQRGAADAHIDGWVRAARAGSIWGLLRLDRSQAAETLATADLARIADDRDGVGWPVREREYTRSLAAMATLMRIDSPTNGSQGARAAGEGVPAAASLTMSVHRLHGVADALTHALGADHPEVLRARRNARVADTFASAPTSDGGAGERRLSLLQWQRHWQPALGCGFAARALPPERAADGREP